MPITLKIGATAYSLIINLPKGKQVYDLSKLNKNQLAGVRELVVNHWCRERGLTEYFS